MSRLRAFSQTPRLFFALWPPDDLRQRLDEQAHQFPVEGRARRVRARNLHVTLAFIGEVPFERVAAITRVADGARAVQFDLELNQVETLPGSTVLCMTSDRPPPALLGLADELLAGLREQGFKMEDRAFHTHVTLARDLRGRQPVTRIPNLHWDVREFVLVESQRARTGSEYTIVQRWPLAAPAASPLCR